MKASILLITLLAMGTANAAQTKSSSTAKKAGETATKLKKVAPKKKEATQGKEDVDNVITNRKLRAETGSKSKLSLNTSWNYQMGTVNKPFAAERPNIRGTTATSAVPSLTGGISGKYRMTPLTSVGLGVGVGIRKPFHPDQKSLGERSYVDNPNVDVTTVYKVGGTQNVTAASVTYYTSDIASDLLGYVAGLGLSHTMIYDFGGSKFSAGLYTAGDYNFFNNNSSDIGYAPGSGKPFMFGDEQSDYSIGFYPFAELVLTDKLNLRTIAGLWTYEHIRSKDSPTTFVKNKIYQSVGLGISVTRDIYLYPNIQFLPEDIDSELTNIALSATVNLF